MKYPTSAYAKALVEAIGDVKEKDKEAIVKNFLALLRKNGDDAHLAKILGEAERFMREKQGTRKLTVESARPIGTFVKALLKNIAKPGDLFEEKINPELVAGIKILVNDELEFDGSLKGKLDKLFSNI